MKQVLLLGINERAGLAICRSLRRGGIIVSAVRTTKPSSAESSNCIKEVFDIGSPEESAGAFCNRLLEILQFEEYDLLIPVDDVACRICTEFRNKIERHVKIALSDNESMMAAQNKGLLLEMCREMDIPFPETNIIQTENDLAYYKTFSNFPVYLKPITNAQYINDKIQTFKVVKVETYEEMTEFCKNVIDKLPILVQKPCKGIGTGVHVLVKEGKILSIVQQVRLHEPVNGGGGSYRMTVPVDHKLREYTEKLMEMTAWTGVAMVEFKGDPTTEEWFIMEINGRFWGSLPLTISAGLNYPMWLYNLFANSMEVESNREPTIYMRQRNLKKDVGWLLANIKRNPNKLDTVIRWLADFKFIMYGKEKLDIEDWKDFLPAIHDWKDLLMANLRKTGNRTI